MLKTLAGMARTVEQKAEFSRANGISTAVEI